MKVIKEANKYAKKYWGAWLTVFLLGWITVVVTILLPQIPQLFIDRIIMPALGSPAVSTSNNIFSFVLDYFGANDYWGMFWSLTMIFGTLLFLRYAGHYVRWQVSHAYGVRLEADIRYDVFRKMITQNTVVMNRYTSGDLMCIANSDPVALKDMYALHISIVADQFIAIWLAVVMLWGINPYLMIIPFVFGLITSLTTIAYIRDLRRCYNEIRENSAAIISTVQENIGGVRIIRSFGTESIEKSKFNKRNETYREGFLKQAKNVSKYSLFFNTMGQLISIGSIILGIIFAVNGSMSVGQFTTFLTYVFLIKDPLNIIINYMSQIQNSLIAGNRIFTFLYTNNVIVDVDEPLPLIGVPDISLRNVSVHLDDREELKNINLEIPFGTKLGIMGKTGSGKSVLVKTLGRFFETTRGELFIAGNNIKQMRISDVRRQFSYVMQDVFLFSDTVESNIAFYDPEIDKEKVVSAAKIAEADDFIRKLSSGYDTIVGERGLGLSGGQKQRISIARALVKDAPILLLDDSTSALDMETERKIFASLKDGKTSKTLIVVSHRATSVMDCDMIIFMKDGEIVERGTHAELMALKGNYYDVFMSQEASRKEAIA